LRYAGEDLADSGAAHGGWALARLGAPPLDTSRTCAQLELRDGEQLHFRPHTAAAPEAVFDDVVDAIATSHQRRRGRWAVGTSRTAGLAVGLAAAVLGAAVCAVAGPPQLPGALAALGVAAVFVLASLVLSRALGDARTGALVAAVALPYAFVGGLLLLGGDRTLGTLGAPHLLVAFAMTAAVAALAGMAVAGRDLFLAAAIAAAVGAFGALLATATPASAAGAAGAVAALALAVTPLLPMLAFRLGRLPMPAVPAGPEDLKRDTESVAGREVLFLSELADHHLTGLLLATAVVSVCAELTLVLTGEPGAAWLCLVVAVALMLRARVFDGARQRLPLLVAGVVGVALLVGAATAATGVLGRLTLVLGAVLTVAAGCVVYALAIADRRLSPYWGRFLDVVEILAVVSVVPLTLLVLGLLGYMRALNG
jgi:type VII secretion integral membrane protein EccD